MFYLLFLQYNLLTMNVLSYTHNLFEQRFKILGLCIFLSIQQLCNAMQMRYSKCCVHRPLSLQSLMSDAYFHQWISGHITLTKYLTHVKDSSTKIYQFVSRKSLVSCEIEVESDTILPMPILAELQPAAAVLINKY